MNILKKLLPTILGFYIIATILLKNTVHIGRIKFTSDMILFLFIIIFLCYSLLDIKRLFQNIVNFITDPLGISMSALLTVMVISVSYSFDKTIAISESARFLSYILLYFIIKYEINSTLVIKKLLKVYIVALFFANIISVFQALTGIGMSHSFYIVSSDFSYFRNAYTFGNPNSFGAFLVISIFPVLLLLLMEKTIKMKVYYSIIVISILANIYLTASKNAWLAVVIGCIVLSSIYNIKFLIGILLQGLLALLIPQIRIRLLNISASVFNDGRLKLWGLSLKMIKEHPLLGVGNGNYIALHDIYATKYSEYYDHGLTGMPTHNSFLKIQSELGIFGTIAFISVIINSIYKLRNTYSKLQDNFLKAFYTGFFATYIVFLFMNLFDNFFFVPKVVVHVWIFIAMADGLIKTEKLF